jgi:hypothetical protein
MSSAATTATYVELMAHYDAVLPASAPRDLRAPDRGHLKARCGASLDYCGLPFDERCCASTRTSGAVRTASSRTGPPPHLSRGRRLTG